MHAIDYLEMQCISVEAFFLFKFFSNLKYSLIIFDNNLWKVGFTELIYKARHAHKRLYTVLPKYSKIQVLPGITSCRLVKDNKQAIELNSLLLNNMPKDGYEWN